MKKIIIAIISVVLVISIALIAGKYTKEKENTSETTPSTTETVAEESRSIYLGYFKDKSFNNYFLYYYPMKGKYY